jgi:hypothetical protein
MENIKKTFIEEMEKIIGTKCFCSEFNLESSIFLDFGRKLIDAKPSNDDKTGQIITYGEYVLNAVCAWRIEKDHKIYCTYHYQSSVYDDNGDCTDYTTQAINKLNDELVKILENKTVIDVSINENTMDLIIDFENNIRFRIFCDQNHWDWDTIPTEMYSFTGINDSFMIGTNDTIIHEDFTGEYIFFDEDQESK